MGIMVPFCLPPGLTIEFVLYHGQNSVPVLVHLSTEHLKSESTYYGKVEISSNHMNFILHVRYSSMRLLCKIKIRMTSFIYSFIRWGCNLCDLAKVKPRLASHESSFSSDRVTIEERVSVAQYNFRTNLVQIFFRKNNFSKTDWLKTL